MHISLRETKNEKINEKIFQCKSSNLQITVSQTINQVKYRKKGTITQKLSLSKVKPRI